MRQVYGLLKIIDRADAVQSYSLILSYRLAVHAKKLPSLEEYLSLSLGDKANETKAFDPETDKLLEAAALKRLEERRREHG